MELLILNKGLQTKKEEPEHHWTLQGLTDTQKGKSKLVRSDEATKFPRIKEFSSPFPPDSISIVRTKSLTYSRRHSP
ncbi:hypothetical protein I3842_11G040000 [Carya illinoinensis]|uniref:Uncharacterized protein n=1 Tax=Carya illinoinensis TaxID=32201 RepID=A0A922IYY2_CARIL|nr:hypothetical protein I3842_11G040000 [Carya illinoinensis]